MYKYRVHFLIHLLPLDFIKSYDFSFDYYIHNYCFYRQLKSKLFDCFIIVRSSSKCWRVSYTNTKYKVSCYRSFRSVGECMSYLYDIYLKYKN